MIFEEMDKQVSVMTWGCSHNQKDSQLIEHQLIKGGYELLPESQVENVEIVILNTCTVKKPTEDKILYILDQLKQGNQRVIITGCLSQSEPEFLKEKYPNFSILGVNAAPKILPLLSNVSESKSLIPLLAQPNGKRAIKNNKQNWSEKPLLDSTHWNSNRNIVQINEGCLNFCTFCATKKARGHLRSFKKENIINSIRRYPSSEVWLTSQDTACWGFDRGENLSDLISEIDKIERKFWIRIGMGNPNNFIKVLEDMIQAFKSDKVYKFLHLPVQSGSNKVLKHMRRGYTVEEYEGIVKRFKDEFPQITLSTDVICGYPNETKEDFELTINTIFKTRPSITNISRFWERKGTYAAELDQISYSERQKRSKELTEICNIIQIEDNLDWVGWQGEIYLAEKGSKGGIQARNLAYKPIIVEEDEHKLGTWTMAEITESRKTYFLGEIIN